MRRTRHALTVSMFLSMLCLAVPSFAQERVGDTSVAQIDSPHPYPPGDAGVPVVWRHTLVHSGATFIKLHFGRFALHRGSALRVLDAAGAVIAEYTDAQNARRSFWARSVSGDSVTIELRADGSGTDHGVSIDQYGYGTVRVATRSICGMDQQEDVACYAGTEIGAASRPVGRMLFQKLGFFFACTGFLISPTDHFLSNEHCIASQAEVDSLEVRFNFQSSACGGAELESFETVTGDQFIVADAGLDVSLMTLGGRPSARHGYLPLSGRDLVLGESLYVPQHSDGGIKKVSVLDCQVSSPMVDGRLPLSDFAHTCDTRPGSSGSPVLDESDQVVGLHHIGGCLAGGGNNKAVLMSRILPVLPGQNPTFALKSAWLILGRMAGADKLRVHGALTLGLGSHGIAPLTEPVTLTLADADGPFYSATVPAGSFHGSGGRFHFNDPTGRIANGLRAMHLTVRSATQVDVSALALRRDLRAADQNVITVTFGVGDDTAAATETFRRRPPRLLFP